MDEMDEDNALDAIEAWVHETGDWTRAAEPAYIKGFEDAQEIVRGLIQSHREQHAAGGDR